MGKMMKAVKHQVQLKLKKKRRKKKRKKKRRRKKKRNKSSIDYLILQKMKTLEYIQGFQVYFFLTYISFFNQNKYEKNGGTTTTLKHRKKFTSARNFELNNNVIKPEKRNYFKSFCFCIQIPMINNVFNFHLSTVWT